MAAVHTRDIGEETLDLLRRLIALQSVNDLTPDSGQEIKAANLFEDYFADLPVTCERIEAHPGRTTLVVTVPGTDPSCEALTLLGHTDVVPVDEKHWTHPPFEGEISDGQIWGRGSVDMLHLTAAMAVVTRRIAQEIADGGARPRATLTFVAAADEEARGGLGVPWIGEHRPEALSWDASLSEMGGAHIRGAQGRDSVVVIAGEKGAAQRRLHVRGDAGHGSIPLGRVSAVEMLGRVSRALAQAQWPHASDEIWAGFVRAFEFDAPLETSLLEGSYTGDYSEFGDLAAYAHAVSHMTVAQTVVRATLNSIFVLCLGKVTMTSIARFSRPWGSWPPASRSSACSASRPRPRQLRRNSTEQSKKFFAKRTPAQSWSPSSSREGQTSGSAGARGEWATVLDHVLPGRRSARFIRNFMLTTNICPLKTLPRPRVS